MRCDCRPRSNDWNPTDDEVEEKTVDNCRTGKHPYVHRNGIRFLARINFDKIIRLCCVKMFLSVTTFGNIWACNIWGTPLYL